MDRRTFIKTAGLGSVAFAYGCNSNQDKTIFSLVSAPDDLVTGQPTWYATTCMECPAGCGVIAKNREGRVIKLEGNPNHPVNNGKLCIRGQSALQSVYDPDRLTRPQLKKEGTFKSISYEQALEILKTRANKAVEKNRNQIRLLTGVTGDPLSALFSRVLKTFDSDLVSVYEPFSHDALKGAHKAVFNQATLPSFHMDHADFILNFGADFIETWLSPVEYITKFKSMHSREDGSKGVYVHVGPFMSLTAANADQFFMIRPGQEHVAALGLVHYLVRTNKAAHLDPGLLNKIKNIVGGYNADVVETHTGLSKENFLKLAESLLHASKPLVLGSSGTSSSAAVKTLDMATTLINLILDPTLSLYDFERRHAIESAMPLDDVTRFFTDANTEFSTGLFMVHNTNPLYTFPENRDLTQIYNREDIFKVSFSNFMDDTAAKSDLVFPVQLPLETWDCYPAKSGVISTLQPTMGKLTDAPAIGDLFLKLAREKLPFKNYYHYLTDYLNKAVDDANQSSLTRAIQQGGIFPDHPMPLTQNRRLNPEFPGLLKKAMDAIVPMTDGPFAFLAVPSIRMYDGRGANKPWLNEIPDPVTSVSWDTLAMIHPDTLAENGFRHGDIVRIESGERSVEAPVYAFAGVSPGLIVMQTGQGHADYGRYAKGYGSNPLTMLTGNPDHAGFLSYLSVPDSVTKTGHADKLPHTDGSRSQYKRKIALSMTDSHGSGKKDHVPKEGLTMDQFPLTLPIKAGYDKKRDVYPPHDHEGYRWGMIVDLDRCVGCSACVAACYAENNIGVVGRDQVIKEREMAWLRIERYQDQNDRDRLIFLPMMCQHCDAAPCESVCPVYAPHHSKEGLNNQVYNRCIGTRFCAQNCPYKVRKFNWYEWKWPEPSNLQLNPEVTARSKGVMEKCSFCIQRIKAAHNHAKNENRAIRDGEVRPACVQTCPAGALTFGSFLDKDSRINQLAKAPRAYQVLGYLNTKSAVIYLKKKVQNI